jgi:hypothetical protein
MHTLHLTLCSRSSVALTSTQQHTAHAQGYAQSAAIYVASGPASAAQSQQASASKPVDFKPVDFKQSDFKQGNPRAPVARTLTRSTGKSQNQQQKQQLPASNNK